MYVKELGFDVKSTSLGFKDIDVKQGIVQGYFSAFDVKDSDGDVLVKGAFAKTITERGPKSIKPRIKHLLDHNKTQAVAVIQDLEEDNIGLLYTSKAGRHPKGQEWLMMAEDGIITEHSTGTYTDKSKILRKDDANYILETKMWEGSSLQAWGANEWTPIVGVKDLKMSELQDRWQILTKALRNGKYSDEAFIQVIEPELKHIERIIGSLTDATTQPGPEQHTIEPDTKNDDLLIDTIKQFTKNLK